VIGTLLLRGGSGPNQPTPFIVTPGPTNGSGPADAAPNIAPGGADQPIKPASVSSRCPAGSTDPMAAFGDDATKAWVCVRVYGSDGQILTIHLDHPYMITRLSIIPGFNNTNSDGSDEWVKHRTVSDLKYTLDGKTSIEQKTHDVRDEVITQLQTPTLASTIQITILHTTAPTGTDTTHSGGTDLNVGPTASDTNTTDFAVSKIAIYGHSAN